MKTENYRIMPLGERLVVQRYKRDVTAGGIIIPDTKKARSLMGRVLAVGLECTKVKVGDIIYYGNYSGAEIDVSEPGYEDTLIMNEPDVLGIALPATEAWAFEWKEASNG